MNLEIRIWEKLTCLDDLFMKLADKVIKGIEDWGKKGRNKWRKKL